MIDAIGTLLLVVGACFYAAGTLGLLRFPDVYSRLHALAKADNLGLGCVLLGLALQAESLVAGIKLLLIWPLALAAASAVSYAIARRATALGVKPWRKDFP
ncbi:MAG: monovalent cation/H(+) antiporter subunit G [Rhodocyclaceae bacterium]